MYRVTTPVDDRRRGLLRAAALSPVLLVAAGCSNAARKGVPLRQPDADSHVRWSAVRAERRLLASYNATIDQHPDLAERLNPIIAHHEEHLAAVLADGPLPIAADGLSKPTAGDVPQNQQKALAAISETENTTSDQHAQGCVSAAGRTLAALLASMAASEAGHSAALAT